MKSINSVVRASLAQHLDRHVSSIHPWLRLDEDLDLTSLELVLIGLELEEIEDVHLPMEELANIRTVGELLSFVARHVARASSCLDPRARIERDTRG